jgi:hypothetical protein
VAVRQFAVRVFFMVRGIATVRGTWLGVYGGAS